MAAWRVSDVAGDRQWHRAHCYNLDFRPFGLSRHLVATAGSGAGVVEGYALVRAGADFTERERDLLGFAQLQLAGLERKLAERQRLMAVSAAALTLVAGHGWGVAVRGEDGRAHPLNALAADLLPLLAEDP